MSRLSQPRTVIGAIARLRGSAVFAVLISVVASTTGTQLAIAATAHAAHAPRTSGARWSSAERATLRTLSLGRLEPLAADRSNRVADDPRAAALGEALFFDT